VEDISKFRLSPPGFGLLSASGKDHVTDVRSFCVSEAAVGI